MGHEKGILEMVYRTNGILTPGFLFCYLRRMPITVNLLSVFRLVLVDPGLPVFPQRLHLPPRLSALRHETFDILGRGVHRATLPAQAATPPRILERFARAVDAPAFYVRDADGRPPKQIDRRAPFAWPAVATRFHSFRVDVGSGREDEPRHGGGAEVA